MPWYRPGWAPVTTSDERSFATSRPRFSIVVPAYNEDQYLPATLQSLYSQASRGGAEIIVVDNNSTDTTVDVARSFGVRVVSETEPGVCQARQRGLFEACGEIVVSVDADTIYPPGWLARIESSFERCPEAVAVAGPCHYVDPPWWMAGFSRALFAAVGGIYRRTGWVSYVTATNTAFRRDGFDGYDLRLTQGGDELDLLRRLRSRGRVLWNPSSAVFTSSRRQRRGLLHTLVISFLIYYLLAYWLNRFASRSVLGRAPVIRQLSRPRSTAPPLPAPPLRARPAASWSDVGALTDSTPSVE
jgi:glycosyltransferase involved in cell wall biosynthesis